MQRQYELYKKKWTIGHTILAAFAQHDESREENSFPKNKLYKRDIDIFPEIWIILIQEMRILTQHMLEDIVQ